MSTPPDIFDRKLLARRRRRALRGGSVPDFLSERVADDFVERLSLVTRAFPSGLSLGADPDVLTRRLSGVASIGQMKSADGVAAPGTLDPGSRIFTDEEALPFGEASLDLIVSGLTLHLVNDLPGALIQMRRALKPDGLLLAALLGGETLRELREAWLIAEDEVSGGASPRVAPFADVRDLGGLLQRAGFALPVADADVVRVTYPSPLALMREIKAMGASNMLTARRRVPVTKRLLARACEVYSQRFGLENGRVPATFEIITLTAWVPHESQQKPLQPGSAKARLADALGVVEVGAGEKAGGENVPSPCRPLSSERGED